MSLPMLTSLLGLPDTERKSLSDMMRMGYDNGYAPVVCKETSKRYTAVWDSEFVIRLAATRLLLSEYEQEQQEQKRIMTQIASLSNSLLYKKHNRHYATDLSFPLHEGREFILVKTDLDIILDPYRLAVEYSLCHTDDAGFFQTEKVHVLGNTGYIIKTPSGYMTDIYNNTNSMIQTEYDEVVGSAVFAACGHLNAEVAKYMLAYQLSETTDLINMAKVKNVTKLESYASFEWEIEDNVVKAELALNYSYMMDLVQPSACIACIRWVSENDYKKHKPSYSARILVTKRKD